MADDRVLLNLVLNESTVQAVEGRIKNIVNRYNNTPINLNIRGTNLDNVINRLNTIQAQMQSLNNASVNINASLTPSQQQYRLLTERLRVSQLTELARQRTLQSENNALAQMAAQNRTLNIQNTVTHQIDQNINNMGNHMQGARGYAHDFVDYLAHGAAHIATYKTLETIMYNVRDAFREIKDVDTSLISVKKTTGLSDEEIEAMRKSSYSVATEYGRTPSEYLKSVAAFARAGYREQSEELGKISLLAQNVAELSASEADEMLLAVGAAFQLKGEVGALTNVVNGLNNVANKNATDMGKLSEGLKVSASMAKTAGLEISDIVSLIAVGTATTQRSGSEIGRAVRSILMNTTALKGTLEDGEIIDDDSISKTHKALEGVGIQVKEVKDGIEQLRNPMDILNDLADKWDSLNPDAQNILLSDMGQKRHANVLSGIIDNWDMAEKVMGEYFNSANSAVEENTLYLQGWESKSAKVSTKWTEFVTNMVDTSLIKGTLDTLYTAIDILDSPLGRLVTQVVLLNTAFSVTGRLWNMVRARSIVADIMSMGVAERDLGTAVELVNAHLRERLALWVRSPSGIATIGLVGISLVTSAISAYNEKLEENAQIMRDVAEASMNEAKEAINASESLMELTQELNAGTKSSEDLKNAFYDQMEAMGKTKEEIDGLVKKYGDLDSAIKGVTKAQLETAKKEAKEAQKDARDALLAGYNKSDMFESAPVIKIFYHDEESDDLEIPISLDVATVMGDTTAAMYGAVRDLFVQGLQSQLDGFTYNTSSRRLTPTSNIKYEDILEYYERLGEAMEILGTAEKNASNDDFYAQLYKIRESLKDDIERVYEADRAYEEATKKLKDYEKPVEETGVVPKEPEEIASSLETLKTASESVATLQKAFKELSEDGYITVDTLAEIQKATGLNDEQFEQYKNTLLTAKAGSEEFNQTLNDLTYKTLEAKFSTTGLANKTEEEVAAVLRENGVLNAEAVAVEAIKNAKAKLKIETAGMIDKIEDENFSLKESAEACNITADAYANLLLQEIAFGDNGLKIDDKISKIKDLARSLIIAGNGYKYLQLITDMPLYDNLEYDGNGYSQELADWANSVGFDIEIKKDQNGNPIILDNGRQDWIYTNRATGEQFETSDEVATSLLFDATPSTPVDYSGTTSGSTPDKPEPDILDYSDYYDEILSDKQKAREHYEEENDKLQREFEQAIEDKNLDEADRIAGLIKDNNAKAVEQLNSQLSTSQKTLDDEILPLIYGIAPELQIEGGWDAVTDVQKEQIRQKYEQAILKENNRWEQQSYDLQIAGKDKESEAYKQAEADHTRAIEKLEYESDMFDQLVDSADSYVEDIKEIPGLMDEWNDKTKDVVEKQTTSINDVFEEYKRHIDRQTDELQKQADDYDILINKAQALADGSRSMYDSLRSVRQLQRDISKELTTNKALGEYLDEDTRKLLFNDDDYSKLSKKLSGISSDIAGISSWYANQINGLTEDNWYLEGAITAEYERRLAMKEKEYEIARAELDIEKKKQELNNILNEKNIRMLTKDAQGNYKWTQIHNVEEASRVAGEIAELEGQISETRLQATEDSIVNQKQAEADALNAEKAAIEKRIELINEETEELATAVEDITNPLMDFGNLVTQLNAKLGLVTGVSVSSGGRSSKTKVGGSTSRSEYSGTGWENVEYDPNTDYQAIINDAIARGDKLAAGEAEIKRNRKIEGEGLDIPKTYNYHTDPKKTFDQGGVAKGKGLMFKDTNYDELVLDPVQTGLFEKFLENTKGFDIVSNQMSNMINSHQMSQIPMNTTTNNNRNVTFEGDIVLNNVSEPQDFMGELAKNLRHYVFK